MDSLILFPNTYCTSMRAVHSNDLLYPDVLRQYHILLMENTLTSLPSERTAVKEVLLREGTLLKEEKFNDKSIILTTRCSLYRIDLHRFTTEYKLSKLFSRWGTFILGSFERY